jgi:ATP-dependent Clp protease ATP-binding subunit ClpC
MFEKFTEGAIKVIMLSQEEARRMGHNFVGTEQLLLRCHRSTTWNWG